LLLIVILHPHPLGRKASAYASYRKAPRVDLTRGVWPVAKSGLLYLTKLAGEWNPTQDAADELLNQLPTRTSALPGLAGSKEQSQLPRPCTPIVHSGRPFARYRGRFRGTGALIVPVDENSVPINLPRHCGLSRSRSLRPLRLWFRDSCPPARAGSSIRTG
jgi:hypothetical protein